MNERFVWCIFIFGGFFLGGIMFSEILPKIVMHKDIEKLGKDRNPGAANVFVNCGILLGMLCLSLDILKGFLPVFSALKMLDFRDLRFALVIAAPVAGHAVAPFNKFHGGKCISTAFGVLLGLLPVTYTVFLLAALYILFSTLIKINPNRIRSIVTFTLFGIISLVWHVYCGMYAIALGSVAVSVTAVFRHSKYALRTAKRRA